MSNETAENQKTGQKPTENYNQKTNDPRHPYPNNPGSGQGQQHSQDPAQEKKATNNDLDEASKQRKAS
jgi:hypothetical protein